MKTKKTNNSVSNYTTIADLMHDYQMNRATIRKIAESAGALIHIPDTRLIRVNRAKFENYLLDQQ